MLEEKDFKDTRNLLPFLRRIFGYTLHHPRFLWGIVGTTALVAALEAVFPLVWMHYIDHLIVPNITAFSHGESWDLAGWLEYATLFFGIILVQVLATAWMIWCGGNIKEHVIYDLRKAMFNRLQELSFSFYDRSATGWLLSRITSDTDRVADLISWGLLELVWGTGMIIFCFMAMFWFSPSLALVVLLTIPLLFVVSVRVRAMILQYSRKARKLNSELTASYHENINGLEVNKTTVQETRASEKFNVLSNQMQQASYKSSFYAAMYAPLVVMVGSVAAAGIVYLGGHMALQETAGITLGTLAAFFTYSRVIFFPIFDITRFYALAQSSMSAGERIFSLIDEKPSIVDQPGATDYGLLKGEITFRQVSFYYVEEKPILQGFDLHIRAGESVALVGPTGEGKTTIASLIARFYEPQAGQLLIDGTDYREHTLHSLRAQLGIMLQTPHLFSGTIRHNICYGSPMATDEAVVAALEAIGATTFIDRLDEEVGEDGGNLSIGEKQLLAFARTLVKNPRILIMDEATSSVDTLAEKKIQQGIREIIKGRTSLLIAHRLSTIRHCDRILVIRKGQIAEEGDHQSLMALKGDYYRLYTGQGTTKAADLH